MNNNPNPPPIPRDEQSFTAAINSRVQSTLTYLLNNTRPQGLRSTILHNVKSDMTLPRQVESLLRSLNDAGIVTSAASVAAAETSPRYCVRCHKVYLERDNYRLACVINHSKPILQKSDVPVNGHCNYRNFFQCCNNYADPTLPINSHFTRRHTTSTDNVSYNALNVKHCQEVGCGNAQPSTSPPQSRGSALLEKTKSIDMMQT